MGAASFNEGPGRPPFTGVVLCGGESLRMGRDKALLLVDGAPMAIRVAAALRAAGATEVWAVGGDADALGALGLGVVPDDRPGEGPLPATITALGHAGEEVVAILSCDLLRPSPGAVGAVIDALVAAPPEVVAAVPVVDGHRQWTHAAWRAGARTALEAAHAAGARSLRRGAGSLSLVEVHDLDPTQVADADIPADLAGVATGAAGEAGSLPTMDIPQIDVAELAARRAAGAPLIDVREDDEYAEAHVPGAHHIALGQVVGRIHEVPTGGTVYVICARGARSAKAVQHYRAQGLDAVNVTGGMLAWIDAGEPIADGTGSGAGRA